MGYPVRSNIFNIGSENQRHFTRFPIQVAVLFSPTDELFSYVFRDIFLHLDQITGDDLAFFAILDPPEDWRQAAQNRAWWQEYQGQMGELGFSFDDRTLVYEIARQFEVTWRELPALVISTNLWTAEFITTPTSPTLIEEQLTRLTALVREWGRPTIGQIVQLLEDGLGATVTYHPSSDERRYRLNQTYGVLETYNPRNGELDIRAYRSFVGREIRPIETQTNVLRRARSRFETDDDYSEPNELFDQLADDTLGRLVPPATVAMRAFQRLQANVDFPVAEYLDEESIIMIESSVTVGHFLENLVDTTIPGFAPFRFNRSQNREGDYPQRDPLDFSPGAQGVWKALEKEANLSFLQAARKSRGIEMPGFFAQFRPSFTGNSRVHTGQKWGRDIFRNINNRDNRNSPAHEFFTLGDNWHITHSLLNNASENMQNVIASILSSPLPRNLLRDWEGINRIRNHASHRSPLSRNDYETTLNVVLQYDFIGIMMRLKNGLRQ